MDVDFLLSNLSKIEEKIGYRFKEKKILALAFVHCSFINENKAVKEHNERLEFLGDSVLGLIVADYLYRRSLANEGELSYLRSRLVESDTCYRFIEKLDLQPFLLLGKGEKMNQGRGRLTILADFFEALIGALYLDGGFEAASHFFLTQFKDEIEEILERPIRNWKALLQDYCQKNYKTTPEYQILKEEGPGHQRTFLVAVKLLDKELGIGSGESKKAAQQKAAEDALQKLGV